MFKLTMLIKRVSGMTEAEFHKYWSESHVPIVNAWLAKHGVVQYVQVRKPRLRYFPSFKLIFVVPHSFPTATGIWKSLGDIWWKPDP